MKRNVIGVFAVSILSKLGGSCRHDHGKVSGVRGNPLSMLTRSPERLSLPQRNQ